MDFYQEAVTFLGNINNAKLQEISNAVNTIIYEFMFVLFKTLLKGMFSFHHSSRWYSSVMMCNYSYVTNAVKVGHDI